MVLAIAFTDVRVQVSTAEALELTVGCAMSCVTVCVPVVRHPLLVLVTV
ncbi:UNVERIFIED_CONTAM: hypothetical protein IGO34_24100 [Salmonella enterica subsp. enterica serovar Weltevreden]